MKKFRLALVVACAVSSFNSLAADAPAADAYFLRGVSAFVNNQSTMDFFSVSSTEWQSGAFYQMYGQLGGNWFGCSRNFSERMGMIRATPSSGVLTLDADLLSGADCYAGTVPATSIVLSCEKDGNLEYESVGSFRYTFDGQVMIRNHSAYKDFSAQCKLVIDGVEFPVSLIGNIRLQQGVNKDGM